MSASAATIVVMSCRRSLHNHLARNWCGTLGHNLEQPLRFQQSSLACLKTLLPRWRLVRFGHQQSQLRAYATNNENSQIAIVGGGLGGLMAARVLQKHGFNPMVFEREPSRQARGQGGQLDLHPKSGQWAMEQAGLIDQFMAAAQPEGQDMRVVDKDGSVLWEETDCTHMDRPEIGRPVLKHMLLDSLQQDTVKWDHHLTAIQPLSSGGHMLKFKNGRSMAADVVIGADGGRSKVREVLTTAKPSYQGVASIETYIADVDRSHPEAAKTVGRGSFLAFADNKGFIAQRQGDGAIRVYVAFRVKEDGFADLGIAFDNAADTRTALLDNFNGWAAEITNLLHACDNTFRIWRCYSLPVGLSWQSQEALTLLGDAAHLSSPFGGNGANLALQDAAELALAIVNNSQAGAAIAAYEASMRVRAEHAARESADGLKMFLSPDGSRQFARFLQQAMGN